MVQTPVAVSATKPSPHRIGETMPTVGHTWPVGQSVHAPVRCAVEEYLPAGHRTQDEAPSLEYDPALHAVHADAPIWLYVPAGQLGALVEPMVHTRPARHAVHTVTPCEACL